MAELFASGHAADIVLAVMALEALWLVLARHVAVTAVAGALAPGALIVLAVRAALVGAAWPWVAIILGLSFPMHLLDLRTRGWLAGRTDEIGRRTRRGR